MNNPNNYSENLEHNLDEGFKKESKSAFGFFIKNYRVTYLIIAMIVVVGFFSLFSLPREADPEVKVPYIMVNTVYLGASPVDVEDLVTNKIEEKINNLDNLTKYTSSSNLGFSSIFVEFNAEADLDESFKKLREAVDEAQPQLPQEAEDPVVTEIRMSDFPIVTYSLVGDYDDGELKSLADDLKGELEDIRDVSKVEIIGGVVREFQVIVDQTKLANFKISLPQVVAAISNNNFNFPAGNIEVDEFKYNVRIQGKIDKGYDLNNLVVTTYQGSPVFLSDIALVKDAYQEKTSQSRIGFPGEDSRNAISIQIYKKVGGNILNIVDDAQSTIDSAFDSGLLPLDLTAEKTNDNSVYIKDDINTLGKSAVQTFILIALILLLILSWKGAIITALSVPLAFLMSFFFLKTQGMTLNSMVLFSLVLSLGLMVDNSIVIIEGINDYVEKQGKSIYRSALLSVWNFKWPIIAGTLTTVSAFVPMLLVSGIMGEYLSIIPKTISVTLLSSLFVALIIIPTLTYKLIKLKKGTVNRSKRRHVVISKFMAGLQVKYREKLAPILINRKKRIIVITVSWLLFLVALAIPASGLMKIEMFPKVDFDYFFINIELPVGSNLEQTNRVAKEVETSVKNIPEMSNYIIGLGSLASSYQGGGSSSALHNANVVVNLINKDERERSSYDIAESIRAEVENIQGSKVTVVEMEAGPPSGAPIEVRILGNDISATSLVAEKAIDILDNIDGVINIDDSLDDSTGEFTFSLDRQKINYYGLNVMTVASTIRAAIYGTKASAINIDDEDVDIVVQYDRTAFKDVNDLESILLFTPTGENIQLKQIADLKLEPALLSINHRDGENIVTVTASIEDSVDLKTVLKEFDNNLSLLDMPEGVSVNVGGETEDIEQSFTDLFQSMIVAVLLIFFILVLQFNSFKQPFIILFSFPLSIIGVIIGLNLLGQAFSITVFIGVVALAGIVVNDAIVLIDKINKNIKNGMEFFEAIIDGGVSRMQPIILTSVTTIAGVIPLIYANEMWKGLSLTVIFGLIFSTFLNLTIIPILYAMMCRRKR